MNKHTPTRNKFQLDSTRRDLPESVKLSLLPKLADRPTFQLPKIAPTKAAACIGCGGRLDADDTIQQSIKVCRKCLAHYAKIEAAIEDSAKRKTRELLEKFSGGAK
jgi:hypothetical protein